MSSKKHIGILLGIVAAILVTASQSYLHSFTSAPSAAVSSHTLPKSFHPVTVLVNRGYTVGYSEEKKDPLWVKYELKESEASSEHFRRPKGGFEPDNRTKAQINTHDYVGSGYDRGHMAPSFAIGKYHGRDAQIETFVMSNIVPQSHFVNDGVWNSIERMEADDFAKRFASVEIVDGPIFDSDSRLPAGVAIPSAFYKAIRRPDGQIIAFIVPQYPESPKPETYLTTVDAIQRKTGVDPFPDAGAEQKAKTRKTIW